MSGGASTPELASIRLHGSCMYVHVHLHMYVCMYVYVCVYIYILFACIHLYLSIHRGTWDTLKSRIALLFGPADG